MLCRALLVGTPEVQEQTHVLLPEQRSAPRAFGAAGACHKSLDAEESRLPTHMRTAGRAPAPLPRSTLNPSCSGVPCGLELALRPLLQQGLGRRGQPGVARPLAGHHHPRPAHLQPQFGHCHNSGLLETGLLGRTSVLLCCAGHVSWAGTANSTQKGRTDWPEICLFSGLR